MVHRWSSSSLVYTVKPLQAPLTCCSAVILYPCSSWVHTSASLNYSCFLEWDSWLGPRCSPSAWCCGPLLPDMTFLSLKTRLILSLTCVLTSGLFMYACLCYRSCSVMNWSIPPRGHSTVRVRREGFLLTHLSFNEIISPWHITQLPLCQFVVLYCLLLWTLLLAQSPKRWNSACRYAPNPEIWKQGLKQTLVCEWSRHRYSQWPRIYQQMMGTHNTVHTYQGILFSHKEK